mgnify:FL=1
MINILEVQQAIWEQLGNSNYTVVDHVDYNAIKPPYVQLGELYIDDDSIKNRKGLRCEQYINLYSTYDGKKELLEMIEEVNELMMTLDIGYVSRGSQSVMLVLDRKNTYENRDSQVKYYHALLKYEIYIG